MTLSADSFPNLVALIESMSLTFNDICRSPIRISGVWHCEVAV